VFVQTDAQKLTQAQRIGDSPRDPTFGIDALKIANQQQAKIRARPLSSNLAPEHSWAVGGTGMTEAAVV
jgi:hypothetical protein